MNSINIRKIENKVIGTLLAIATILVFLKLNLVTSLTYIGTDVSFFCWRKYEDEQAETAFYAFSFLYLNCCQVLYWS